MSPSSQTISLNSTDSLPIPPRSSSRQQPSQSTDKPRPAASQLGRYSYPSVSPPSQNTSRLSRTDSDNRSDTSPKQPPSPTPSSPRRKPVPPYLPMPDDLPSDHPFALGRTKGTPRGDGTGSEAGTPGWRDEKDLFFSQQQQQQQQVNQPTSLAPPPRKNKPRTSFTPTASGDASPAMSATSVESSDRLKNGVMTNDRRGTFDGLAGLNISMNGPSSVSQVTSSTVSMEGYETARTAPSSGSSTPNMTPRQSIAPTITNLDRPLPPLPDNASVASMGMESILGAGPSIVSVDMSSILGAGPREDDIHTRSNSSESRPEPTTPRTDNMGRQSPMIHGMDGDASSSASNWGKAGQYPVGVKKGQSGAEEGEEDEEGFSVSRPPSKRKLWEAGTHFIRDEEGRLVYFGDLFPRWGEDNTKPPPSQTKAQYIVSGSKASSKRSADLESSSDNTQPISDLPTPKTVLFFIRNFWCGQCQDYMFASVMQLDPEALAKANIRVAVISTGSWKFIKKYRKLTKCPFPVYVDGAKRLYDLMGMKRKFGEYGHWYKGRAAYNQSSVPSQIINSFKRAPKLAIGSNPGNLNQMGGEFVLEPGFNCSFAHRMTNYSNHMEAPDVLRMAGCEAPTKEEYAQTKLAAEEQLELERLQKEMTAWRSTRETEIDRIRRKKAERRGMIYEPISNISREHLNLDPTPAFGPTDRRASEISAITSFTVAPERPGQLEVTVPDEVNSTHTDEVEEIEEDRGVSEKELEREFERAMRVDEEMKGRFEERRGSAGLVGKA